jgi:uncharacterized membrane protein YebE (DUF533 family)
MPMHEQNVAILKGLVAVAWADGTFADSEKQALDGLLAAFGASDDETKLIHDYAKEPKKMEDIPLSDLSADDRRMLMSHAVLLSYVDGEQAEIEREFLESLSQHLRIPKEEADAISNASAARAKKYLKLLD